jgi:predicted GNAT superfamily acetyltransferase
MLKNILVRRAIYKDVAVMKEICEENLLDLNCEKTMLKDFANRGFLMSRMDEKYTQNMIVDEKNYIVLVAESGGEIMGYLTACDISKIANEFKNEIEQLENHRILYYKQIAKKSGLKGVGKALILELFDEAKCRNYTSILCKIVHEPLHNRASDAFHGKYGFKQLRVAQEEGRMVGIYLKKL